MANQEVVGASLINLEGKVLSALQREAGQPKLVFNVPPVVVSPQMRAQTLVRTVDEVHITTWTQINVGTGLGWVKLTSLVALDQDELASLRQQTLWLSIASLLSGAVILGLFLWRAYFSFFKREHVIADQLDDVSSRLHQSEKLASLGQLAAGVAHEINNPIGYVSSNLNTLNKYIAIYEKTIDQLLAKAQAHPPPALSPAIR
jgi:signal transduction histidine kinase